MSIDKKGMSSYEAERERTVQENKRKMEALNLRHLSAAVAAAPKAPSLMKHKTHRVFQAAVAAPSPLRRSRRLAVADFPEIKYADAWGKYRIKTSIRVPAVSAKIADIPADDYSWRKYGQKPIKGSPYARGYYKCSTVRGCPARKHVERALDDPAMLVVTYQGEHRHSSGAVADGAAAVAAADGRSYSVSAGNRRMAREQEGGLLGNDLAASNWQDLEQLP